MGDRGAAEHMEVGQRCVVDGNTGEIAFLGSDLPDLPSGMWVGVVYDQPVGKNDGTIKGKKYFKCQKNHGHLVRPDKVKVLYAETALLGRKATAGHASRSHALNDNYMENFHAAYALLSGETPEAAKQQNAEGTLLDLSDRPNTCISVWGGEAVIGSTDHALYGIDLVKQRKSRTLYTKTHGHTEWVTCVSHTADGRVLSGGMDGKLCLWNKAGAQCSDLQGHSASISDMKAVQSDGGGNFAFTSSYDKTVCVWDLSKHASRALASSLKGHSAPVLCMAVVRASEEEAETSSLVSGDRDGVAMLWDVEANKSRRIPGHGGHITSLAWLDGNTFLVGAQDGKVKVWDVREERFIHQIAAHVTQQGSGAVGNIVVRRTSPNMATTDVVTAGADCRVQVLDARSGFQPRFTFTEHKFNLEDFIYSLAMAGSIILSGAGDGMLLAHDVETGAVCWGLGANKAAVRCIASAEVMAGKSTSEVIDRTVGPEI
ncbi:hypothetical protein GUITHDRAFT_165675 [Guillardia theta CCMP2712]|uniref:CAP-Gly domain-containing protein n=1 Tax=Guillardia theta (strain CCMP2712) TaxID=905079 RepID=L1IK44_GUITC|nr:hypothetical protein GUITHDRAFT_165675 [Guillardia theta CCMP2712]EKX36616.1 hypothetical protein GUITHDRAFT_165675 [Guillardia theta CCMP2712]|eukprot:XP_005823596.1 hypothetical protein GUITHDRAFT_165675 [Guillardia theta CCMP2712]